VTITGLVLWIIGTIGFSIGVFVCSAAAVNVLKALGF
jgi:hypothetical protein